MHRFRTFSKRLAPNPFARGAIWVVAAMTLGCAAPQGDFSVLGPDGRTLVLRQDGTWRYAQEGEAPVGRRGEEAVLTLIQQVDDGTACRFVLEMVNNLPYEIHTVVPTFVAYRANGALYRQVSVNFNALRPGDAQRRTAVIEGLACKEISRVQVTGGSRCTMGDLDMMNASSGACLDRIRVVPSSVTQFSK